jgi:hypothetical protein
LTNKIIQSEKQFSKKEQNLLWVLINLGKNYTIRPYSNCIERDLKNGIVIKVNGAYRKEQDFSISVWEEGYIVEFFSVLGVDFLKIAAEHFYEKYRLRLIKCS